MNRPSSRTRLRPGRLAAPTLLLALGLACRAPPPGTPEGRAGRAAPRRLSWVAVPANDPRLQTAGRVQQGPGGALLAHPGGTMRLRLWGDAVRLRLRDFGDGTARGTNVYEVLVDGVPREPLEARASQTEYVLAEGLVPGEHTVSLTKRTEGFVGRSELLGFDVHGELLEPPPPPALRMELVGDSITCGYGNAVAIPASGQPATGFHSVNEDVTRSYGWLAARSLGAEASVVCASGRGVFRNLDGSRTGTLPELYERVAPEADAPAWDASRQVPDIVVVNLGTNDLFAPGPLREQDFTGAYRRFVTHLRTLYPRAHLVLAVGSMLHDSPENPRWSNARAWVGALVRDARLAGDRHISFLAFEPQSEPFGEDWHPSAATHRAMAERLVAHLRRER